MPFEYVFIAIVVAAGSILSLIDCVGGRPALGRRMHWPRPRALVRLLCGRSGGRCSLDHQ